MLPRNSDKDKQCKFSWRQIMVYIPGPPTTLFKKSYLPYCGLRAHEDGRPCNYLSIAHRGRWLYSASFGALSGIFFGSSTFHHCCCLEQSLEEEFLHLCRELRTSWSRHRLMYFDLFTLPCLTASIAAHYHPVRLSAGHIQLS